MVLLSATHKKTGGQNVMLTVVDHCERSVVWPFSSFPNNKPLVDQDNNKEQETNIQHTYRHTYNIIHAACNDGNDRGC